LRDMQRGEVTAQHRPDSVPFQNRLKAADPAEHCRSGGDHLVIERVQASAVTTILARRAQVHQVMLASHTSFGDPSFRDSATALADRLGQSGVGHPDSQALSRLYESMRNQASTLSYIDTFWMLGIAAGIMFLLTFLLRKSNPRGPRGQVLAH
jgi:hypothetical protein